MDLTKIVAGVDGSGPSLKALRWAATEAQLRQVDLEVVLAYHWSVPGTRLARRHELADEARNLAESMVDAAVAEARTTAPQVRVQGVAVEGEPVSVLLAGATDADMVVVGNRGAGGFASLLLGSVSARVAMQAPCPVAVVRGRTAAGTDPVVVGVNGSPAADIAAGVAFEEASRRGCPLVAVWAFHVPLPARTMGPPPVAFNPDEIAEDIRYALVSRLIKWHAGYPDTPVEYAAVKGSAAAALTDWSRQASLVVVGSRGHGAVGGLLLGSVGLQLIHHAECPVLIARTPATA